MPQNVQDYFSEMFRPGLLTAPPADLELKIGEKTRVPLGSTRDTGSQHIKVDLGRSEKFVTYDDEESVLIIDQTGLDESDVGVYKINVFVDEIYQVDSLG